MLVRLLTALGVAGASLVATPAWAGRTVIDAGMQSFVSGYCSPLAAGTADCQPRALGFSITLGTQSYDSFVLHSNGVLALGSAIDYVGKPSTLSGFKPPVFSPLLDSSSYFEQDQSAVGFMKDDGAFVADYALSPNQLALRWYPCTSKIFCGAKSADPVFYSGTLTRDEVLLRQQAEWSFMTLTKLDNGFSVTFDYSPRYDYVDGEPVPSTDPIHYGFDLPTASFEGDGPAVSRTFLFDAAGALLPGAVPEPATWLAMLVGFGVVGAALRRARAAGSATGALAA